MLAYYHLIFPFEIIKKKTSIILERRLNVFHHYTFLGPVLDQDLGIVSSSTKASPLSRQEVHSTAEENKSQEIYKNPSMAAESIPPKEMFITTHLKQILIQLKRQKSGEPHSC